MLLRISSSTPPRSAFFRRTRPFHKFRIVLTIAMSMSTKATNYGSMASGGQVAAAAIATPTTLNVDRLQEPMRATHESGVNLTYEWRIQQLKTMRRMLVENRKVFQQALQADLGRDPIEAYVGEILQVEKEVDYFLKNLQHLMRPTQVPSPAVMIPGFTYLERRPLSSPGVCIIGSCNFPFQLSLRPAVGSLAGGNPTVVKPSELTENTCNALKQLIPQYFEPGALQVVTGAVPETTALLEKQWGMMVFTGSERVGKIVAESCAKTLTPVLLELGGKCPVIVDETATHLDNVADRIIFGKLLNAGQVCVAPDTLFVHEKYAEPLREALVRKLKSQFGKDPKQSGLPRMVLASHAQRQVELIQEAENDKGTTILCGGSQTCDPESKYVCPTIVSIGPNSSPSLRILNEEIFGPILPIVTFKSREEVVKMVRELPGTPLALIVFTSSADVFNDFTNKCPSGMAFRNDMVVHMASSHVSHGGLGSSGIGAYHGKKVSLSLSAWPIRC